MSECTGGNYGDCPKHPEVDLRRRQFVASQVLLAGSFVPAVSPVTGRWWYLDLAQQFPELEIHTGHGWGPAQELGEIELGGRVMLEEALWLPTWFYSEQRDREYAAVARMFAMVIARVRRDRTVAERILRVLAGDDPGDVAVGDIPGGWVPGVLKQEWQ